MQRERKLQSWWGLGARCKKALPSGQELKVDSMPLSYGRNSILQHDLGLECFSLDGFKQEKKAGNVVPPYKPCTCAAMAASACVSDFHAAWEMPHPPYVWNISAVKAEFNPCFLLVDRRTDRLEAAE